MRHSPHLPPNVQMLAHITGFWTSCCIYTVCKLSVPDLLAGHAKTAEKLADETQTHAPSLYRVMRALSSLGVFMENVNGEFALTQVGDTLRSDVPGSLKAMALAQLGDHFSAWANLMYSVRTGEIAFDHIHDMDIWKYYETHTDDGINFTKAMMGMTQAAIHDILPAYDFGQFNKIMDIGGGNGTLLVAILKGYPHLQGIIFDQKYIQGQALQNIEKEGLHGRCSFEVGNFFDAIPSGIDAYIMKMILHDWSDEKAHAILMQVAAAMDKDNKLIIIEAVVPEDNSMNPSKFLDINMLVMTGGKERTQNEWEALLGKAGLRLQSVISTDSPMLSIMEVVKA